MERGDLRVKRQITRINGGKETEVLPVLTSPDSVLHMLHQVLKRVGLSGDFSAWFTPEPCAHVTTVSQRQAAKATWRLL
ncbi:hypothetical protein M5E87_10965 [Flavonifractor plautii]|nr:hypothetical protein M5E87_10965 [Flavonifractor plautii]